MPTCCSSRARASDCGTVWPIRRRIADTSERRSGQPRYDESPATAGAIFERRGGAPFRRRKHTLLHTSDFTMGALLDLIGRLYGKRAIEVRLMPTARPIASEAAGQEIPV